MRYNHCCSVDANGAVHALKQRAPEHHVGRAGQFGKRVKLKIEVLAQKRPYSFQLRFTRFARHRAWCLQERLHGQRRFGEGGPEE